MGGGGERVEKHDAWGPGDFEKLSGLTTGQKDIKKQPLKVPGKVAAQLSADVA